MKELAPVVLRIGMAIVFLWFGTQQLLHTSMWVGLIPALLTKVSGLTSSTLVHFNGAFEIVFGLAVLIGYQTRVAALFLGLHLLTITLDVGYGAIGVRDFGLSIASLAVALYGAGGFSLDARKMISTVANS